MFASRMSGDANGNSLKHGKYITNGKRGGSISKTNGNSSKRKRKENFEFGNYNRYYGYRIKDGSIDPRLEVLRQRSELFVDKDILDIGCNIGHITYMIGRHFRAKSILGIDIDNSLIKIARKNLRFYCPTHSSGVEHVFQNFDSCTKQSIDRKENHSSRFPENISFLHVNFVPYSENLLLYEEPKYDVILCLSVTKWIHLNWGDDGLRRTFKKVFRQLRSGGVFVLEAQPFESYKKKKLCSKLRENCQRLKFFPSMFDDYLLNEIGFTSSETLPITSNSSVGFQRPIQLFLKS